MNNVTVWCLTITCCSLKGGVYSSVCERVQFDSRGLAEIIDCSYDIRFMCQLA